MFFLYIGETQVEGPFPTWDEAQLGKKRYARPHLCKVGTANIPIEGGAAALDDVFRLYDAIRETSAMTPMAYAAIRDVMDALYEKHGGREYRREEMLS